MPRDTLLKIGELARLTGLPVKTIRLAATRRVLRRELTIADVAAAHAAWLEVRIRALRLHRRAPDGGRPSERARAAGAPTHRWLGLAGRRGGSI